ncbi:hypothetical protein WICPIJ_003326 [Wickerhamomyces pijperi]|uniref:Protein transport protein Sec61 subunit gamma n=1 Tax=Wickerhamomyces pijperi TaxID=599730 RepID=A0A9P8Q819_WICPI|nr:hypothetical protein WICPIJ_003326 [Wickerhamomyces pijperi]
MAADGLSKLTEQPVEFIKDGAAFVQKYHCYISTEPVLTIDPTEYLKIIRAVGVGFIMMGVVGYAIKLIHIPIRYLIV